MKSFYTALFLLLATVIGIQDLAAQSARKLKAIQQKEEETIKANIQTHINVLAADSLEGRRTGSAGEMKAVNYIINQYKKLGISSGDADKDYVQDFEIDEGKILQNDTKLLVNGTELKPSEEWFPLAWSKEGKIKTTASLALLEKGQPWWIDLKETLETNAGNPHFLPEQFLKEFAKNATGKGASALIVFNSSNVPDSLVFNGKDRSEAETIPIIYCTYKALKALHIDQGSSPYIELTVGFSPKKRTGHNVLAFIDNGAASTIVLGAHLDHLGYGEDGNSRNTGEPAIHNGADDNASGTAAILEIARLLKEPENVVSKRRKKTIPQDPALKNYNFLLIHFSGEELGLYGSKYFTEHPGIDLSKVNCMINYDMVGRLNESNTLTIGGIGTSQSWGGLLPEGSSSGFTIKIDSSGTGPSDHTSFYRKDIPVLFFFTGLHSDYHKPDDDADKVNYKGEARIISYSMKLLKNIGNSGRLAFEKTREQTVAGGRFKVSIGIMPDYTFTGAGVRADGVIEGRPAQKAGLITGDVIIKLGDFDVTSMETYMQALNKFEKGNSTSIKVSRGNETKQFEITF